MNEQPLVPLIDDDEIFLIEMSAQTCDFSRGSSRLGFEEASCCKIFST